MGDAPGALGGAIPQDKALRDCCVSFPKRTILSSASVGIRAGDVTEIDAADQEKLIILSSTSTRTFSNCKVMLITHEKCITNLHMTKKISLMD